MQTLKIIHDTFLKADLSQSSSLLSSETIPIKAGVTIEIISHATSVKNHLLVALKNPMICSDNKTKLQACFVYEAHLQSTPNNSKTVINQKHFFDVVRTSLFKGVLHQDQVNGMETILNYWESKPSQYRDHRWLAYILGTVFHETAQTMKPLKEYGRGHGYAYSKADPVTGQVYYGRGYPQLTWKSNYEKFSKILGIDLVNHPDDALKPHISAEILFYGMVHGSFTGQKLSDYFNANQSDWYHARAIINPADYKTYQLVADYSQEFYKAINVLPIDSID